MFQKIAESFFLATTSVLFFFLLIEICLSSYYYFAEIRPRKKALEKRLEIGTYFANTLTLSARTGYTFKNPFLNFRYIPNIDIGEANFRVGPIPEEFSQKYSVEDLVLPVNEFGFIKTADPKYNPFKSYPDTYKILCIGGSTMAGWGTNYLDSIPSYLFKRLREEGLKVQVINAGVTSNGTFREFQYYALELVNLEPDIVIYLDGVNDRVGDHAVSLKTPDVIHPKKMVALYAFLDAFLPNTKKIIEVLEKKKPKTKEHVEVENYFKMLRDNYNITMENTLRNIIGISIANDVVTIMELQPHLATKNPDDFSPYEQFVYKDTYGPHHVNMYPEQREIYSRVKNMYKDYPKISVLDMTEIFYGNKNTVYFDKVHYSASGNKVIANSFAEEILRIIRTLKLKPKT